MGLLTVGRVGLDVSLDKLTRYRERARDVAWRTDITGYLRSTTLALTNILRTELLNQSGDLIPITYSTDANLDGFYLLDSVDMDISARQTSQQGVGYVPFRLAVTRIGSYAQTELQSLLTMVDAAEDFATSESFWWAPSIGAQAVDAGGATPVIVSRDGEDGTMSIATDMVKGTNPSWSIPVADYYDGAAELWAGDRLRTGTDMPMDPTDWYITNSLMEVRPDDYQGTSSGEIEVRFHDGTSWGSWVQFFINWSASNKVPSWNYVSIVRNSAAAVTIRLVRDAAEAPFSTTAKHELDITLRRGGRFISCVYKFTGAAEDHALEMDGSDTVTRPGGGTASYVLADTLVSGDQIIYGCPRDFTLATREISLDVAAKSMPFWIGAAVDDAANGTGNGPADLAEQYVGQVAESVRAVRR